MSEKKPDPLHVGSATVEDDGESMFLRLELRNDSDSTLHFVSVVRQLLFDPATKELTIRLTEHKLAELPIQPPFEVPPPMAAVDPRDRRDVVVKVPRYVTRVEPGPTIVQLPAHEAVSLTIEVGWSDRAFYRDPRGKGGSMRAQLKKWERGVATFQGRDLIQKRPRPKPSPA